MLSFALLISGIVLGSTVALVTAGFSIIHTTTGTFHIAHGLTYGIAGFVAYSLNSSVLHLPLVIAAVLAALVTACAGVLIEAIVYQPLRRAGASALSVFVASFGLLVAGLAGVQMVWGSVPRTYDISVLRPVVVIWGTRVTDIQIGVVGAALAMLLLLALVERRSRFGLAMQAVAGNRERAALLGLNVRVVEYGAFAFGSALVIPAAVLDGAQYGLSPTHGLQIILLAIVAQVVGGLQSLTGGIAASYLIGIAGTLPLRFIDPKWQNSLIFGLLFVVLLIRPQGLFTRGAPRRYETKGAV